MLALREKFSKAKRSNPWLNRFKLRALAATPGVVKIFLVANPH